MQSRQFRRDPIRSTIMKSPKYRLAMSAAIFAIAAGALGANAAGRSDPSSAGSESAQFEIFENGMSRNSAPSYTPSEHTGDVAAPRSTPAESRQFENFEHQMTDASMPSYTASEHATTAPAPRSGSSGSVFDDPANTASPGA
jgi:hypothetical protein